MHEIRGYWTAVRDAKDGEYITVRDADSKVRIAKKSGNLLLHVDESPRGEKVRMTSRWRSWMPCSQVATPSTSTRWRERSNGSLPVSF
jgi:hypothetical protein